MLVVMSNLTYYICVENSLDKRKKLEAKGWKVTSVAEFLELTPEENSIVELKLALSKALKNQRLESNLTQKDFAKLLKSSQSRIAKMEAGDKSVSLELLIRSLFKIGVSVENLSEIITARQ